LIDFGYDGDIDLNVNESKNVSEIWDISDNIDKDNLWIIAVVFNSDSKSGNSDPDENSKPFNAYYADAAHGVKVTEEVGQAPPSIVITTPKDFHHYIFGRESKNNFISATYVIGKLTIEVDIEAEAGIDRVEYKIKGPIREFSETITNSPYSYDWNRLSFGRYTITVILYDYEGNTNTDNIEIIIFNL
jgi:hypothetical protein